MVAHGCIPAPRAQRDHQRQEMFLTRMGEAGRRWVVDNWQWSGKAQRLAELL